MTQVSIVRRQRSLRHRHSRLQHIFPWLASAVVILSAIACNFPGAAGPAQPTSPVVEASPPTPTLVSPGSAPTPTLVLPGSAPTPTNIPSGPTPTPTLVPGVGPTAIAQNACDLIPAERVQSVMGEAVTQTSSDAAACVHVLASNSSVTAAILTGDAARNAFIGPIAQLSTQEGCSLSFSSSSSSGATPTPLPAEVEQLVAGKSLAELGQTYVDVTAKHCGAPIEPLARFGDFTFFQTLDLGFVETASLGIVQGDKYVTYTIAVADPKMDPNTAVLQIPQAQERLKALAKPVFAP